VAFVMPYIPHDKFHEYFDKLSPSETQNYMKNLLIAIAHVHSHDIIHRDIKPSNFLFNRAAKTFLLVDFGLAQDLKKSPAPRNTGDEDLTTQKRKLCVEDLATPTKKRQCLPTNNITNVENKDISDNKVANFHFKTPLKQRNQFINDTLHHTTPLAQNLKSTIVGISVNLKLASPSNGSQNTSNSNQKTTNDRTNAVCFCYGKSQVCNLCIVKKEIQASRAGTPVRAYIN
jgi:cell division control protein 7